MLYCSGNHDMIKVCTYSVQMQLKMLFISSWLNPWMKKPWIQWGLTTETGKHPLMPLFHYAIRVSESLSYNTLAGKFLAIFGKENLICKVKIHRVDFFFFFGHLNISALNFLSLNHILCLTVVSFSFWNSCFLDSCLNKSDSKADSECSQVSYWMYLKRSFSMFCEVPFSFVRLSITAFQNHSLTLFFVQNIFGFFSHWIHSMWPIQIVPYLVSVENNPILLRSLTSQILASNCLQLYGLMPFSIVTSNILLPL